MNKKGFMLAELIITSTIVVAAMIGLYASFNKLYSLYKVRNNYYDIDGIYATKEMTKSLINNDLNDFVGKTIENGHYKFLIEYDSTNKKSKCNFLDTDPNNEICNTILNVYHIKNMIFSEYDKCILDSDSNECTLVSSDSIPIKDETFKEYVNYVINYYDIKESDTDYNYVILTEIEENQNTYYSNLRIR